MDELKIAGKIALEAQDKATMRKFQQGLFQTFNKMKKRLDELQKDMLSEAKKLSGKVNKDDVEKVAERLDEMIEVESQEFNLHSWDYLSDDVMILRDIDIS